MLKSLLSAVKATYSGPAAKDHVAAISQFHRLQASPGYRRAADYCLQQLRSWGIQAEILSFPADRQTTYWTCSLFQEWDAAEATLDLLLPSGETERLADYREDKISLVQRSLPFEGEAEVVVLEEGTAEEEYAGVEVAGKVVLAQGDVALLRRLAIEERGAIGILSDGMRECPPVRQRIDLPDARQYTAFWWRGDDEPKGFGFVLTPRQGDRLRTLARRQQARGEGPLRIRARVVSQLYDGRIEVVSALIPGQTAEEVLVVAHLCHPQASANDNASGAGAVLEVARTLGTLAGSRALPAPRRGIRLLWVPEMTGTYAYLATHEEKLARMVAGINLDMVGQNQALCESVFLIERPPEALASFAGDLVEALQGLLQESAANLAGTAGYPLYRQAVTPFSGGSDHYILSDPSVGIPSPMLIQWPDRFYHTSADTIDKVDPQMLAVAGGLAAAYAGFVAAAGEAEARWLAGEIVARARGRLARLGQDSYTAALEAGSLQALGEAAQRASRQLAFWAGRAVEALGSLGRLAGGLEAVIEAGRRAILAAEAAERSALEERLSYLGELRLPDAGPPAADEWTSQAEGMFLRRLFRGPLELSTLHSRLDPDDQALWRRLAKAQPEAMHILPMHMVYWLDGRRSLREIADRVECEAGRRDVELMVQVAGLMLKAGLLERVAESDL